MNDLYSAFVKSAFEAGFHTGQLLDKLPLEERRKIIDEWFEKWIAKKGVKI